MNRKRNTGFTLVELIVVISIIGILAAVLAPQYIQYVDKARQAKAVQEASIIDDAARVALTEYISEGGKLGNAGFKYENKPCHRISNFWLSNKNNLSSYPDYPLAKLFIDSLGFKKDSSSSIPFGTYIPGTSGKWTGCMGEEAAFQVIYTADSSGYKILATQYSRNGYFVSLSNGESTVEKLANANKDCFYNVGTGQT